MIEATNLLKELVDQKSDLGKLSQMDSSTFGEKGSNIYDESLAKSDAIDSSYSTMEKPWYEDGSDSKENFDEDLLNSQNENEVPGEWFEENSKLSANHPSDVNNESEGHDIDSAEVDSDTPDEQTSYIEKYGADGGRYKDMKDEGWGHNTEPPTEVHHMPANSASELPTDDGPCIVMDYEDHRETASCGNSREAQEYRAKQKELIEQGKFREAFQMDVDDIQEKFGDKYDDAISKAEDYLDKLEKENRI